MLHPHSDKPRWVEKARERAPSARLSREGEGATGSLGTLCNRLRETGNYGLLSNVCNVCALRVCHTACLGRDNDVVVFGGSSNMRIVADLVCKGKNVRTSNQSSDLNSK